MATTTHTFTWNYSPDATEVIVTGSFDNWSKSVKLEKNDANTFSKEVTLPVASKVVYKFVVDGNWCCDIEQPVETDSSNNANNVLQTKDSVDNEAAMDDVEKPSGLWIQPYFKINDSPSTPAVIHQPMSAVIETIPEQPHPIPSSTVLNTESAPEELEKATTSGPPSGAEIVPSTEPEQISMLDIASPKLEVDLPLTEAAPPLEGKVVDIAAMSKKATPKPSDSEATLVSEATLLAHGKSAKNLSRLSSRFSKLLKEKEIPEVAAVPQKIGEKKRGKFRTLFKRAGGLFSGEGKYKRMN